MRWGFKWHVVSMACPLLLYLFTVAIKPLLLVQLHGVYMGFLGFLGKRMEPISVAFEEVKAVGGWH